MSSWTTTTATTNTFFSVIKKFTESKYQQQSNWVVIALFEKIKEKLYYKQTSFPGWQCIKC